MEINKANSINELSKSLRCERKLLDEILANDYKVINDLKDVSADEYQNNHLLVRTYTVKKRGKKNESRRIHVPVSNTLKSLLKILSRALPAIYNPSKCVHGFVRKRNIKTNADQHLGCKFLLNIDIENFFEQITKDRIVTSLVNLGIHSEVANCISAIVTIGDVLVQGFNTSPIISNIVAIELDNNLEAYTSNKNITFTRYADDMSFSSHANEPNLDEINKIILNHNFNLNQNKTRLTNRGNYQSVTGLTIFDRIEARIPKRIKQNLRLEVYYVNKFGIKNHAIKQLTKKGLANNNPNFEDDLRIEIFSIRNRLTGWINYSYGIEKGFSNKLNDKFSRRHIQ